MAQGGSRRARVIVAVTSIGGIALATVGACTLYSTGLADSGGDASVIVPGHDATAPDAPVEVADAQEAAADVGAPEAGPDGCAPIETNCLDGLDNDCNGLTDCADPACTAGYECVPSPATEWTGYSLYDDGRATACPSTYGTQEDTYEGLIFSPAQCAACVCTASGAACGTSAVACGPTCGATLATLGATCDDFGVAVSLDPSSSCSATVPTASAGTCASSGGAATSPPVSFSKLSRTCGETSGPGGGCSVGQACVAKPPSGTHGVCVSQAVSGATLCPSAYPHAYIVMPSATSFDDTRGCTSCSCGSPRGVSCAASVTLYPAIGCTDGSAGDDGGGPISFAANGTCQPDLVDASTAFASGMLQANVTSQGSCTPDGGTATGTVLPTNQTAYCCQD